MNLQAKKILIADDEPGVVALLKDYFEINSYVVYTAYDGEEAISKINCSPDIILLDVNMPKMNGLDVCKHIRQHVSCPIIFLTARIEDNDKIAGFVSGGDDYVTKPFSIDELGARVEAHLRRENRLQAKSKDSTQLRFDGNLIIDYSARTVSVNGTEISFAKKEFDIIELLSQNRGQVFDKERIYERIWGYDSTGDSSVIAEHVKRIRVKLKAFDNSNERIETVWGVGYKWR